MKKYVNFLNFTGSALLSARLLSLFLLAGSTFFFTAGRAPAASQPDVYEQKVQSGQVIVSQEKPPPPKPKFAHTNLQKGMKGEAIEKLHELLRLAGFSCLKFSPDDLFGENTKLAVKKYQQGENDYLKKYLNWQKADVLPSTGVVDKRTAQSLQEKTKDWTLQTYAIKSGDTLGAVASKFKIPVEKLALFNNLTLRSILQIGQKIYIPVARPAEKQ